MPRTVAKRLLNRVQCIGDECVSRQRYSLEDETLLVARKMVVDEVSADWKEN